MLTSIEEGKLILFVFHFLKIVGCKVHNHNQYQTCFLSRSTNSQSDNEQVVIFTVQIVIYRDSGIYSGLRRQTAFEDSARTVLKNRKTSQYVKSQLRALLLTGLAEIVEINLFSCVVLTYTSENNCWYLFFKSPKSSKRSRSDQSR
jgi:hypothetical protein